MKNILLLTLTFVLLISCDKVKVCNNLPTGSYNGVFTSKNHNTVNDPDMTVSLVDDISVIIDDTTFARSGCEVRGTFPEVKVFPGSGPIFIDGEIKKKKQDYVISGTFYTTERTGAEYIYGTFSFEKN